MHVVSSTKDFYDYVAHLYGGGDPKIVYARKDIGEPLDIKEKSRYRKPVEITMKGDFNFQNTQPYLPSQDKYDIAYLIVAGCPYTLYRRLLSLAEYGQVENWSDWKVLHPKDESTIKKRRTYWFMRHRNYMSDGEQNELLVTLSQQLGHPVFVIDRIKHGGRDNGTVVVNGRVPNLGELGFASIKSAEQTYQDISYFVGNTMLVPTPDNMPVIKQTDKEKVLAHGLDLKQSFRHRKII